MRITEIRILRFALPLAALVLDFSSLEQAQADDLVSIEPMRKARSNHSATLLLNGKLLVAGRVGNTAELFDPATETWTPTGAMRFSR